MVIPPVRGWMDGVVITALFYAAPSAVGKGFMRAGTARPFVCQFYDITIPEKIFDSIPGAARAGCWTWPS